MANESLDAAILSVLGGPDTLLASVLGSLQHFSMIIAWCSLNIMKDLLVVLKRPQILINACFWSSILISNFFVGTSTLRHSKY